LRYQNEIDKLNTKLESTTKELSYFHEKFDNHQIELSNLIKNNKNLNEKYEIELNKKKKIKLSFKDINEK